VSALEVVAVFNEIKRVAGEVGLEDHWGVG
jgi:hypothetical protein